MQKIVGRRQETVARGTTPPNNIGPRSTKDYRALAAKGVFDLEGGGKVFAGQREDAFFGDIGAIFDLVAIRKGTGDKGGGKDFFAGYAVHALALQIPISQLDDADHTIGIWATTERKQVTVRGGRARTEFVQVSRLGNPLVNEVIIPTQLKDRWNRMGPASESEFARFYREPILAGLFNQLYKLGVKESGREDLVQVLLTGVPKLNFTGPKLADMLRINLSVPPTAAAQEEPARRARRRHSGLAERPAARRRRHRHRRACGRRRADRQAGAARRRRRRERRREPRHVPLRGRPAERLRELEGPAEVAQPVRAGACRPEPITRAQRTSHIHWGRKEDDHADGLPRPRLRRPRRAGFQPQPSIVLTALVRGQGPQTATGSSHREAPLISDDPAADNTDVYAFRSPDKPDTVTLIANYIPLEEPAGGPNFNKFGDDVRYSIFVENDGDGRETSTSGSSSRRPRP